jgi:hypothetical protein
MKASLLKLSVAIGLAMACNAAQATYIGNPLTPGIYAQQSDSAAQLMGLGLGTGTFNPSFTMPSAGTVTSASAYFSGIVNTAIDGGSFTVYQLRPQGTNLDGNLLLQVIDSESFSTNVNGAQTFTLGTPFTVQAGDGIGFLGVGYRFDTSNTPTATDGVYLTNPGSGASPPLTIGNTYAFFSNAPAPPATGTTTGTDADYYNLQRRLYAVGVNFEAVPEPSALLLAGIGLIGVTRIRRRQR